MVSGGLFPNITSTGLTTIGPIRNGTRTISLEGLDITNCIIEETITKYCNCTPDLSANNSVLYSPYLGESVTVNLPFPFSNDNNLTSCDTIWVSDLNYPYETIIAYGLSLIHI